MTRRVVFTPEAEAHLLELHRYISGAGSPEAAGRYTNSIVSFCEELGAFPIRGRARDDIRPGLRTVGYRRRVVIAFAVINEDIVVVGIFYGGRDYEAALTDNRSATD